jgi:uncharacterized protein (TIRG00374 family)
MSAMFMFIAAVLIISLVPVRPAYKLILTGVVLLMALMVVSGLLLREHLHTKHPLFTKTLRGIYNLRLFRFLRSHFSSYRHFEDYVLEKLDNIMRPFFRIARSPGYISKILSISTAASLLQFLAYYAMFRELGVDIGFYGTFIIVSIAVFAGDMAISPGGAGFMETVMIALCGAWGMEYDTAAAVTLVGRGVFYLLSLGIGGISLLVLTLVYGRRKTVEGEKTAEDPRRAIEELREEK